MIKVIVIFSKKLDLFSLLSLYFILFIYLHHKGKFFMATSTSYKLFPAIKPFKQEFLSVSPLHRIYVEQCGNPKGVPVLFVHGGPGGGLIPLYRRFFDPHFYRIVLFDQRGCGQSAPYASTEENTTWDLVEDMAFLKKHYGLGPFLLFGGSWGSTLSLAYATRYPQDLLGMILRGIFLCRSEELDWFYEAGAHQLFPDLWEKYYLRPIKEKLKESPHLSKKEIYHQLLNGTNKKLAIEAAKCWSTWEGGTSKLKIDQSQLEHYGDPQFALAFAKLEAHYFHHKAFFPTDNYLIEQAPRYAHLPGTIIHGRYDVVCPLKNAWDLHKSWPKSSLRIMDQAGHSCKEAGITKALVQATEDFRLSLKKRSSRKKR
jgi:proline iminopeptidase